MKLKALFLGTAAAFAVSGGAQAADLALAVEPIDYVKVCDAFGTGYYYIPGTDTCLKVGGYIQMDIWFYSDNYKVGNYFNVANQLTGATTDPSNPLANVNGVVAGDLYALDDYSAAWEFKTEAGVNFTAKSMGDLGPIVTNFNFVTVSNNFDGTNGVDKEVRFDGGYGAIGPMMFGWTASTFDVGGGYTYDGAVRSDKKTDQFRLSYLMGTWGIMLGLEDPRDRYSGAKNATGDYPDIVLALTGGVGGFDMKLSGAVTDRTSGTGWGVALAAEGEIGGGFKLKAAGAYSDNAKSFTGGSNCSDTFSGGKFRGCDDGEWWSAFVSGSFALSGNMDVAATASWQDTADSRKNMGTFTGALGIYYHPTSNSEIGAEVLYTDPESGDSTTGGHLRWKTSF
ncbi:porin [Bauldia litoralis]|uniref:Porin n=1 Tax=Bauldia litoralis TaxID=665467 RepID=A0A1G6D9C1_9HYPH|nr:porin [Bauldia litoralis]SDB41746.1 Porin subfamily protein [Bauldia litoralis]